MQKKIQYLKIATVFSMVSLTFLFSFFLLPNPVCWAAPSVEKTTNISTSPELASKEEGALSKQSGESSESGKSKKHTVDVDNSESVSMSRPNAIYGEILGRGGLYSVNYDRMLFKYLGLGAGLSVYHFGDSFAATTVFVIPVYSNIYVLDGNHRPFFTVGADIVWGGIKVSGYPSASAMGAALVAGAGYEFRGDSGFLFRVTPYLIHSGDASGVWIGFSLGGAF